VPIAICPNCTTEVDIDPDQLGRQVACPHCDQRFIPEARRRTRRRDDEDGADDRPRRRSRAAKSRRWPVVLVAVFGGLFALVCVCCMGLIVYMNTARVSFDGPWAEHAVGPPGGDRAASASFPKPPISDGLSDDANRGTGTLISYSQMDQASSIDDAVFALGYVEYPPGTPNPLERGYLPIREQLSERFVTNHLMKPKVKRESSTPAYGYPAKEVEYSDDDGSFVVRLVHVTGRPRAEPVRLVVVLIGGSNLRPADRVKFLESVRIGK
jgi:hypothetical protein